MGLKSKGITIDFGTNGWSFVIVNVTPVSEQVDDVDTTHQASGTHREYEAGSFVEGGEMSFTVQHDPDIMDSITIGDDNETVTVTFPPKSGQTNGATEQFPGYLKRYAKTADLGSLIEGQITVKVAGAVTYADGS